MNSKLRGITCTFQGDEIYSFLDYIVQEDYDCYALWCLKNEKEKLVPQAVKNFKITHKNLNEFGEQGLWELVMHVYPHGIQQALINTYHDFVTSGCICCLIYYDCGVLDIYIKEPMQFQEIWNKLILLDAENMVRITDNNDCRIELHL